MAGEGDRELRLSAVFRLTYGGLWRRPFDTFFIGLFFVYLPTLLVTFALPMPVASPFSVEVALWWVKVSILTSPSYIFYGWIAFIIADDFDGPRPRLPLIEVFRRLVPLLLLAILVTVVATLGTLLLVIPGVAWSLAMTAATPALMVERLKVLAAANRSMDLTANRLWSILGCVIGTLAPFVLGAIILALLPASPLVTLGVQPIFDALMLMAGAAFAAAIYRETRRLGPLRRPAPAAA